MRRLLFVILVFGLGCQEPTTKIKASEEIQFSLDVIIERAIFEDKKSTDEAHQKGHKNVVGLLVGRDWRDIENWQRVQYIRGLVDMLGFVTATASAGGSLMLEEADKRKQNFYVNTAGIPFLVSSRQAVEGLTSRLTGVTGSKSFGELAEAVTLYYTNHPLDREKPVLWVLSVPLFNQLGKKVPMEERVSVEVRTFNVPN